jgi:transcriptional regulator with XRE-family HTH domain
MRIGEVVARLRLQKNLPTAEVYRDVMSRSNYNRFEHGQVGASYEHVQVFLHRLGVSYAEFMLALTAVDEFDVVSPLLRDYTHGFLDAAVAAGDADAIQRLAGDLEQRYQRFPSQRLQNDYLLCQAVADYTRWREVRSVDLAPLRNYLQNCAAWGRYELQVFARVPYIFTYPVALEYLRQSGRVVARLRYDVQLDNVRLRLVANMSLWAIQEGDWTALPDIREVGRAVPLAAENMYGHLLRRWVELVVAAFTDHSAESLNRTQTLIEVCTTLGMDVEAVHLERVGVWLVDQFRKRAD